MQYITPKASFALKCNDISLSDTFGNYPVTNNVGTINATRTSMTWYSINLENILGDLYSKYEFFNLRVKYVECVAQVAFGVTADDRAVYFNMSGLNWYNSNYDTARGCNVGTSIVASNTFSENTAAVVALDDSCIFTIRKQKTANITIDYLTVNNVAPNMNANTQFPRVAFYFDLTPVITDIPQTIELSTTKCSSLYTYYLGVSTTANNLDMYAILGRENFEIGAKYNLVLKFAQSTISANYLATMAGNMFLVTSNGMRFQNYETPINRVAGTQMQMVTYGSFQGTLGTTTVATLVRNQTSGIMTFTLEAQICSLLIQIQNMVNNTESTTNLGNVILVFDIWKCI
jgi:hypothetical protein